MDFLIINWPNFVDLLVDPGFYPPLAIYFYEASRFVHPSLRWSLTLCTHVCIQLSVVIVPKAFVSVVCHVALNRPSYQSSVYSEYVAGGENRYYSPSLANDGSRITQHLSGSTAHCAHSYLDTNPWWAVDLGVPLSVQEVFFTNRDKEREYQPQYNDTRGYPYKIYKQSCRLNVSLYSFPNRIVYVWNMTTLRIGLYPYSCAVQNKVGTYWFQSLYTWQVLISDCDCVFMFSCYIL